MATLYEQERDARIRSNNAVMEKLGINALVPPALRAQKARLKSAQRKRRTTTSRAEDVDVAGRRRSSRLAQQAAVVYTTFDNDDDLGDHRPSKARAVAPAKRRPAVHPVPEDGEAAFPDQAGGVDNNDLPVPVAGSTMGLQADVPSMQVKWLGRKVVPQDGSGSMKLWALMTLHGNTRKVLKFNKYSGIIQFANAIALFVNVRSKTEDYPNLFLDGGRKLTWFGARGMDAEHPIIKRILACTGAAVDGKMPVVLFCREQGDAYVYFGLVAVDCFYPNTHPLKIVFKLCDYDSLAAAQDVIDLDMFADASPPAAG